MATPDPASFSWVILGSGNAASQFAAAFASHGIPVKRIYSRTLDSAKALADLVHCPEYTDQIETASDGADCVLSALKDSAAAEIWPKANLRGKIVFHTAGSLPMNALAPFTDRFGVIYPLQTLSKKRLLDFADVPLLVEGNGPDTETLAETLAMRLGSPVTRVSSEQRKALHLAAVFANNFSNHMFYLAQQIAEKNGVPFRMLEPIIGETVGKLKDLPPLQAQTGPAIRFDENVMKMHRDILASDPETAELYDRISWSIHKAASKK